MSATKRTSAFGRPAAGRLLQAVVDDPGRVGAVGVGHVDEQLVVQAQHDRAPAPSRARTVTAHRLNSSAAAPCTIALRA